MPKVLSQPIFSKAIEELGPEFYDPVTPARFPGGKLRYWNHPLCQDLGWEGLFALDENKARHFHAFEPVEGSLSQPLALRYHGHQFQHYNPDLGDGRGFLYAQVEWQKKLWDFGTKGSGQTPYSRSGDGRLTLKGAFREALATELLEAKGVNTSRSFCFFETFEELDRNDEPSPTRSAVLTRFSHSHIRIGSFQRPAFLGRPDLIEKLLRYSARHLLPELDLDQELKTLAENFLQTVSRRLSHLTAQWMLAGFVHGVLNTDNLNITGESFDYGPYRFLPHYDPHFTAAYFDRQGLYSYGRQPALVFWALEQLAASLRVAVPSLNAAAALADFGDVFSEAIAKMTCHRLNVKEKSFSENSQLVALLFHFQETQDTRFEQSFFDLFRLEDGTKRAPSPQDKSYDSPEGKTLLQFLTNFEIASHKRARHPYWQRSTPITLLIDEIEAIWAPIAQRDDWSAFDRKIDEIRSLHGLDHLAKIGLSEAQES